MVHIVYLVKVRILRKGMDGTSFSRRDERCSITTERAYLVFEELWKWYTERRRERVSGYAWGKKKEKGKESPFYDMLISEATHLDTLKSRETAGDNAAPVPGKE
jgi:hypothetical protein